MAARVRAARAAAAVAAYAAVVVWLTWPLGAHLATHIPSTTALVFDALHTAWVLSWQSHTLTAAPLSLPDANIYHPTPGALYYGQTAFGALPYFAPVYLASGNPALAMNVMFVAGVSLTAAALHLVVHHWTRSHLAGAVAACTFLTTRWVLWEVIPTAPQYALLHGFPAIVLLAATPGRRFPLPLLALVVLQALVDPVYLGAALVVPLGLLAAVRLVRRDTRTAGLHGVLLLAVTAVVLAVAFASHLAVRAENPNLAGQTLWTTPMAPFELPWGLLGVGAPTAAPSAFLMLIALGAASAIAAGRAATAGRAWAHASLWTTVGVAMALAPSIVPGLALFRVPARAGVAALIGMALLAGLAFAECARRLGDRRRWAAAGLAAAVAGTAYAEYRHGIPHPALRRPPLPAYGLIDTAVLGTRLGEHLAAGDEPLLEVPVGEGIRAARLHARAMYRSIFHWRPLVNGYDGYHPTAFPERMALARRLPDA